MQWNKFKITLLLLILSLNFLVYVKFELSQVKASPDGLSVEIQHGYDDAFETGAGSIDRTNSWIYVCSHTAAGYCYHGGLRFQNVNIPKGAEIVEAKLEIFVHGSYYEANCKIYGHKVGNSPPFGTNSYNITNRERTDAYVNWTFQFMLHC